MTKQRATLGFTDELEQLNPQEWGLDSMPKPKTRPIPNEEIQKVAQATGFKSRESVAAPPEPVFRREGRIHRTGRSEQLNLKVRTVDKERFYALCDQQEWVLGLGFQRAIEALERELKTTSSPSDKTTTRA
jgi:hypothetical protein